LSCVFIIFKDNGNKREVKGGKLKASGLWYNLDDEKLIQKESAIATLMKHLQVETIKALEGKEVETVEDDDGYLCFKAY